MVVQYWTVFATGLTADRPAALDTAPLPFYFLLLRSAEGTKSDSLYPGGGAPSAQQTSANSGFSRAGEWFPRSSIRSVHEDVQNFASRSRNK